MVSTAQRSRQFARYLIQYVTRNNKCSEPWDTACVAHTTVFKAEERRNGLSLFAQTVSLILRPVGSSGLPNTHAGGTVFHTPTLGFFNKRSSFVCAALWQLLSFVTRHWNLRVSFTVTRWLISFITANNTDNPQWNVSFSSVAWKRWRTDERKPSSYAETETFTPALGFCVSVRCLCNLRNSRASVLGSENCSYIIWSVCPSLSLFVLSATQFSKFSSIRSRGIDASILLGHCVASLGDWRPKFPDSIVVPSSTVECTIKPIVTHSNIKNWDKHAVPQRRTITQWRSVMAKKNDEIRTNFAKNFINLRQVSHHRSHYGFQFYWASAVQSLPAREAAGLNVPRRALFRSLSYDGSMTSSQANSPQSAI